MILQKVHTVIRDLTVGQGIVTSLSRGSVALNYGIRRLVIPEAVLGLRISAEYPAYNPQGISVNQLLSQASS